MKTTTIETQAIRETRKSNGAQRVRIETRRDGRTSLTASGDGQIAEIERTFSVRWEW